MVMTTGPSNRFVRTGPFFRGNMSSVLPTSLLLCVTSRCLNLNGPRLPRPAWPFGSAAALPVGVACVDEFTGNASSIGDGSRDVAPVGMKYSGNYALNVTWFVWPRHRNLLLLGLSDQAPIGPVGAVEIIVTEEMGSR